MTRPSAYPRWADVSGDVVEPTSGKKDVGWVSAEKPPAQYMNWWQKLVYDWIVHLDAGQRVLFIPASAARVKGNTNDDTGDVPVSTAANDTASRIYSHTGFAEVIGYEFPLSCWLNPGDRITEIVVYGREGNAGGETYTARLYEIAMATSVASAISNLKTSGITGADTTLSFTTADTGFTPSGYSVSATNAVVLSGDINQASSNGEVHIHGLKITYDKAAV